MRGECCAGENVRHALRRGPCFDSSLPHNSGARCGDKKKSHDHPLGGLFFLAFEEKKKQWQGRVEAVIGEEYVLVQLFSWLDGSPTNLALVTLKETCLMIFSPDLPIRSN